MNFDLISFFYFNRTLRTSSYSSTNAGSTFGTRNRAFTRDWSNNWNSSRNFLATNNWTKNVTSTYKVLAPIKRFRCGKFQNLSDLIDLFKLRLQKYFEIDLFDLWSLAWLVAEYTCFKVRVTSLFREPFHQEFYIGNGKLNKNNLTK